MSFDASAYLRRATGRAKSDVANKLVSMFLHDVSRKICATKNLKISDSDYAEAVLATFGKSCCYCGIALENDRTAIEHLDGMNRTRIGLHIPGNVILACTRCNREKRRDDSLPKLTLAKTGWESFLLHNSENCTEKCKSCAYWKTIWPDSKNRIANLNAAKIKISHFRAKYKTYLNLNVKVKGILDREIHAIYRDCQAFATSRIKEAIDEVVRELGKKKRNKI